MKVLIQEIDRYQSTTPIVQVVQVGGDWGKEAIVQALMVWDTDMTESDVSEWMSQESLTIRQNGKTFCIFGDETDLIFTNLDELV